MPGSHKPSIDEILKLYKDTKERYDLSGVYNVWKQDERMYELDFRSDLMLPKEFEPEGVVLPTARTLVDVSTDHTDIANIRVWVNKKGEGTKSDEDMNLLRKFGLGVIYRNNVEASIAPLRVAAKHFWLHGLAVIKTVWDADRWADRPERTEGESEEAYSARIDEWRSSNHDSIPIVLQAVHPSTVLLDPYYDGGMFVFEVRDELCFNAQQMFDSWSNPKGRKITEKVEHISFWTKDWRCELYDEEPVMKVAGGVAHHSYGFIPYTIIDTGLGNLSADNDLKKRYVGVLRYVKELLVSESRDYSIGDVILKRTAYPSGYIKGANSGSVGSISQKFGEYTALPDGVEVVDSVQKLPPDALLSWMGVAGQYLASHAAPPSVRGQGETGVRSGSDRRLLIAEASTRYEYSNQAFRHGVAKVLSNCARIMKNVVPGNINVWSRTPTDEFDIEINKDKMKEPFTFYVEFAPISEEDEYRRHDDLERLYKAGLVTKNWARKQMSNVDPVSMEFEEEVEKLKADPGIQVLIGQYLAGKLSAALSKQAMADAVKNGTPPLGPAPTGMAPPPTGQPMEPGRRMETTAPETIVPGSAQQLQNQMANQRRQTPMTQQGQGGGGNRR